MEKSVLARVFVDDGFWSNVWQRARVVGRDQAIMTRLESGSCCCSLANVVG